MTRAVDLLKNKFGVSQLYKHNVKQDDEIILTVYWHPLTIAEREAIQKKSNSDDVNDYALQMMIEKSLDKDAYGELEHEEYEKQREQAQRSNALRGKRR